MNHWALTPTTLLVDEAVALAAAQTAILARRKSLRCLFIKGPAAVAAGVRPARPSADIDVLVHPDDATQLLDALSHKGWLKRPSIEGMGFSQHSDTLYHPDWPCDIDVHFQFPGFDVAPVVAFDSLAKDSESYDYAGIQVSVPSKPALALVQILHALRSLNLDDASGGSARMDYDFARKSADSFAWTELARLLDETQSWAAMKPFLLDAHPIDSQGITFPEPSADWLIRAEVRSATKQRWITLVNSPWKYKTRILWRSLFPSRSDLAATDLAFLKSSKFEIQKYRITRIIKFAKKFPNRSKYK